MLSGACVIRAQDACIRCEVSVMREMCDVVCMRDVMCMYICHICAACVCKLVCATSTHSTDHWWIEGNSGAELGGFEGAERLSRVTPNLPAPHSPEHHLPSLQHIPRSGRIPISLLP